MFSSILKVAVATAAFAFISSQPASATMVPSSLHAQAVMIDVALGDLVTSETGVQPEFLVLAKGRRGFKPRPNYKKRRKARRILRGIGAAIGTAIIINEMSRASRGRYEGRGQCRRWSRSCDRGNRRACRRYYRNCE